MPDEVLCALLWEHKDKGRKGYDLTERLFEIISNMHTGVTIHGPRRAGKDIMLGEIFKDYPKPDRSVDFVISEDEKILAIGFARYDSDRGGSQEDDRPGQYREVAQEFFRYADIQGLQHIKIVYVNDGPGLLLGSMWKDYAEIETMWRGRAKVATLRMLESRVTLDWLRE